jgi:mitochondrial import inner membrane translocase subunit TIM17
LRVRGGGAGGGGGPPPGAQENPPPPGAPPPPPPPPPPPGLAGALGGGLWNFVKGYRNAPRHSRLAGGFAAARVRAPILGGNFAVWGGLFSVFDCGLAHARGTEDPWNAILAGGLTGGVLAARSGPAAMGRNAAIGMVLIALIEGLGLAFSKFMVQQQMRMAGGAGAGGREREMLAPPVPVGYGTGPFDPRIARVYAATMLR